MIRLKPDLAKPIKASDKIPAVIRAIGIPRSPLGTSISSRFSRIPAKMKSASAKPNALPIAYTVPSIRLYCFCVMSSATPNIVQLVVIRGKKTPSA